MSPANVKPQSGGRSQNHMPPEAAHAVVWTQETLVNGIVPLARGHIEQKVET